MGSFTTMDAYVAGYLVLKGFSPALITQNSGSKIIFSFPDSEQVQKEIFDFNAGAVVNARQFSFTIKNLKSKIFSIKMENEKCKRSSLSFPRPD